MDGAGGRVPGGWEDAGSSAARKPQSASAHGSGTCRRQSTERPGAGDAARRLGAAAWRALSEARWPPPLTPTTEGPSAPRCRPGTLRAHDALSRPTGEDLTPKGRSQNSKYIHEIPFLLKMSIDASVAHPAGDLQRIYIFRISLM